MENSLNSNPNHRGRLLEDTFNSKSIPDIDVVLIHGLYGNGKDDWPCSEDTRATWLKSVIFDQLPYEFFWIRCLRYCYSDDISSSYAISNPGQVEYHAQVLLESLLRCREGINDASTNRPIIMVSNDIGGLIVKQALAIASLPFSRFNGLQKVIRAIIFFGCPHRAPTKVHMEDNICRLLFAAGVPQANVVKRVQTLSDIAIKAHRAFLNTKLPLRITLANIFSTETALQLQVFDKYSATVGLPFEIQVGIAKPHMELTHEPKHNRTFQGLYDDLGREPYPINPDFLIESLPALLLDASPLFPQRCDAKAEKSFGIEKMDVFQKWMNRRDSCILCFYGNEIPKLESVAWQVYDILHSKKTKDEVIHFKFDSSDHRFNTILSMLSTILSQLTSRYCVSNGPLVDKFLRGILRSNIRSEKLLFQCWIELLLKGTSIPTTYILSGIDQCKGPVRWFLKSLVQATAASERSFKIFIVSVPTPEIKEVLEDMPILSVDSAPASAHNASDCVPMKPPSTSEYLPEHHSNFVQPSPEDSIISNRGLKPNTPQTFNTEPSGGIVADNENSLSSNRQVTVGFCAATETKFLAVMSSIPPCLRPLCHCALALLLGSLEPLTWSQISTLLDKFDKGRSLSTHILNYLGPFILEVDGSIKLLYPIVQMLSSRADGTSQNNWYNFSTDGDVHAKIAMLCISYLRSDIVQGGLNYILDPQNQSSNQEIDAVINTESPLWYATARWPDHYHLATALPPLKEKVLEFFGTDNKNALCNWAKLYSYLSSSETPLSSFCLSPLTIASGLGMSCLLDGLVDRCKDDLIPAISEAARNDYLETYKALVQKLESIDQLKPEVLEAAQMGGTRCLSEIVIHSNLAKNKDLRPPSLLYLITLLGITEPLKVLIRIIKNEPAGQKLLNEALHAAVLQGDLSIVKHLVNDEGDDNSTMERDETHLLTACTMGHIEVCKFLLGDKPRINAIDESFESPLVVACTFGKNAIVEWLCKDQSLVLNADSDTGKAALICAQNGFTKSLDALLGSATHSDISLQLLVHAVEGGYTDICRLLLKSSIVIDREEAGRLFRDAATHDDDKLMDLLMTHLSETGTADCEEEKIRENNLAHHAIVVLNIAAGRNFLSLVDYILQWGAKECIEDHSNLFEAAKAGHFKVVQRLIDAGADRVRAEDWVPILQACDSVEVISLLLNKSSKPEINMVTRNGTALQVACCRHSSEMVELLLKHGANPNQEMGKFSWVDHPLIQAVNQGFAEIVRMLLEAGANVDARTTNDNTPLHYALYSSKIESNDACLRTLLEFSPELDFQDRQGDTALNCLVKTTPVLSVRLLLNAGADPEIPNDEDLTPIFHAIQMQNFDVAQFLIKKGVSINFSAGEIGGPIHLACKENSLDLIDVLIKHGADVDLMADGFVGTPLQSAFSHWDDHDLQKNIVNRLLDAKADVNRKGGRYGYTINFAFLVCPPEIVQLLLNSGADTDVEDRYGRNPAHLASLRTITHVEKLQSSPQLFQRKDHLGRNALHYAVGSGRLDVVKRVFEICKGDIDVRDMDDWTPLMWAARCHQKPSDNYFGGQNGAENEEIIQFLVKTCGADIRARGRGWDREWSPLKLARYHGASQTIRDLLSPLSLRHENISGPPDEEVPQNIHHGEVNTLHDQETNSSPFLESDKKFHRSKTAREHQDLYCDSCLYSIRGVYFRCLECLGYNLCFKCYLRREELHEDQFFEDFSDDYESSTTNSQESCV